MEWPRTCEWSGQIGINDIGNNDLVRLFQCDGIKEFITINSMPNSLVNFYIVSLTKPCCIHH